MGERGKPVVLQARDARELVLERLRELRQIDRELVARALCVLRRFRAGVGKLGSKLALQALVLKPDRLQPRPGFSAVARVPRERRKA